jgi:hypothetical protein
MAPSNRLPEPVDYKDIQDTIDKYTKDFPAHRPSTRLPASEIWGDVILLTGSTGHFGSAVLAQLVLRTHVKKIYAFNRPHKGGKTLKQRHLEAFLDHGQDIALLNSPKLSFVEGDTSRPDLGITNELYAEVGFFVDSAKRGTKVCVHTIDRFAIPSRILFTMLGEFTLAPRFDRSNL